MGFLDELRNECRDVLVAGLWTQGLIGRHFLADCDIGQCEYTEQ
jgi:hypothetical protein